MNSQTSHLADSSQTGSVSDVLKLNCPFCHGTLNLRRIHLGIEGECVHCHKPVTAIEDDSGSRLVSSMGLPDSPFPGAASVADPVDPPDSIAVLPKAEVDPSLELIAEPFAEKAPGMPTSLPIEPSQSPWGFPAKEIAEEPPSISFSPIQPQAESEPVADPPSGFSEQAESAASAQPIEETLFQSPASSTGPFQKTESSSPGIDDSTDVPPPLTEMEEVAPEGSQNATTFQENAQVMDVSSHLVEEPASTLFQSSDGSPPLEPVEETVLQVPPPLEPSPEVPASGNVPPALPAAAFSSSEDEVTKSVANNGPMPGGISPFSTGSAKKADPGFAETLFAEQARSEPAPAHVPPSQPDVPNMSAPDDVAFNAANQWGPAPVSKTSDGEELDFSAIPPVNKEKAPAAESPVITQLPKKRKSGPGIFKKIFKFFLTLGIIGGIAFAANTFVPPAKWGEWKQQAIDWLEPGSVILEKLPFGKNKSAGVESPPPKQESATRTREQISKELLQIPQRQPAG